MNPLAGEKHSYESADRSSAWTSIPRRSPSFTAARICDAYHLACYPKEFLRYTGDSRSAAEPH